MLAARDHELKRCGGLKKKKTNLMSRLSETEQAALASDAGEAPEVGEAKGDEANGDEFSSK